MMLKNPIQEMKENLTNGLKEKSAERRLEGLAVRVTTDYGIFKKHELNRDVKENSKHVDALKAAIQQSNLLATHPILVNEKMQVIDGQHRLEAAKQLKIPVYYIVDPYIQDEAMASINANQRSWDLKQWLKFHAGRGNPHYIKFKEFLEDNEFKIVEGLMAIQGGQKKGSSKGFQRGVFKFPEGENLSTVRIKLDKYWRVMDLLKRKSVDIPAYLKSSNFKVALLRFVDIKSVDLEYFLTRLELKMESLRMATSVGAYLAQFEAIYNYGTKVNRLDLSKEMGSEEKAEIVPQLMLQGMLS